MLTSNDKHSLSNNNGSASSEQERTCQRVKLEMLPALFHLNATDHSGTQLQTSKSSLMSIAPRVRISLNCSKVSHFPRLHPCRCCTELLVRNVHCSSSDPNITITIAACLPGYRIDGASVQTICWESQTSHRGVIDKAYEDDSITTSDSDVMPLSSTCMRIRVAIGSLRYPPACLNVPVPQSV